MSILRRFNPGPGAADLWEYIKQPQEYRWPIVAASCIPVAVILLWAGSESVIAPLDRPNVTYITTLDENRTDEEILASNIENQRIQDERRARIQEIEDRKRELYKALGAASGMDVEAMEEQAAAERAREEAELEALRREVLENRVVPGAADAAVRSTDDAAERSGE